MLNASIRINPLYDFAFQCRKKYVDCNYDFSGIPKNKIHIMESFRKDMQMTGRRQYQHRVFSKYEKFLQDIGVSLKYQTNTTPTVYTYGKNGSTIGQQPKIGRNDPCYCNSGKKFKKCCGY